MVVFKQYCSRLQLLYIFDTYDVSWLYTNGPTAEHLSLWTISKRGFVFQKRGNIRINRVQAKKFTQNEYNSLDDVEVCDIETADNGSQEFYHASPDGSHDSIETDGLIPNGAEI